MAAGHPRTASAGAEVLRAGGNAVDAAIAAVATSFTSEPCLTSAGGGGIALVGRTGGPWQVLDAFSVVPGRGLGPPRDLDFHAVEVDFGVTRQSFHVGRGSVAVPGLLPGLVEAWRRFGHMPLSELLSPAQDAANAGVPLSETMRAMLAVIHPIATWTPGTTALFGCTPALPDAGTQLANPALGALLEALGRDPHGTLVGAWREALLATAGPAVGGRLTPADLDLSPTWRDALVVPFAGGEIATVPPPGGGGPLVAAGLRLADHCGLRALPLGSVARLRAELEVLAAQGRARHAPWVDDAAAIRAALSDPAQLDALLSTRDGPAPRVAGATTHVSVVDTDGLFCAVTHSNGEGCGHVLDGLGVHLNNFLGEEDINPEGFHRAPPGTPLRTMMSPTAWTTPAGTTVLGSGGSKRIRSALVQVLWRLADGTTLADAIHAPRTHVEGDALAAELVDRTEAELAALQALSPTPFPTRSMFFGGVHAVRWTPEGLDAAADARRGAAVAWA